VGGEWKTQDSTSEGLKDSGKRGKKIGFTIGERRKEKDGVG